MHGQDLPPVPFGRPSLEGRELDYVRAAVESGRTACGGPFSARCAEILTAATESRAALLTTSCTDALEMAALLLDLDEGDLVVVPSFTFVSSALAFVRAGARIVFCDIEPVTLGLDPDRLAEVMEEVGPAVRAVVVVHYAGVAADLAAISEVLAEHPAALVEDNAHGLFGAYRGRPLGGFGRFATLSFHETKNFMCGEGGALLVNDERDVERAWVLYDKGTNRRAFMSGEVDRYTWCDTGSSFGLSDVLAAYLLGQLEQRERILAKRRAVHERYAELLAPHAEELGFRLPVVPPDRTPAYHMFFVLLDRREVRDEVLRAMRERGVGAVFHYVPLHSSPAGRRFAARPASCPVTDDVSGRILRLPFFNDISEAEIERVVETFLSALQAQRAQRWCRPAGRWPTPAASPAVSLSGAP
jgi:dTDP-4-amino-4,6-dideoxygalactose transaminase